LSIEGREVREGKKWRGRGEKEGRRGREIDGVTTVPTHPFSAIDQYLKIKLIKTRLFDKSFPV